MGDWSSDSDAMSLNLVGAWGNPIEDVYLQKTQQWPDLTLHQSALVIQLLLLLSTVAQQPHGLLGSAAALCSVALTFLCFAPVCFLPFPLGARASFVLHAPTA